MVRHTFAYRNRNFSHKMAVCHPDRRSHSKAGLCDSCRRHVGTPGGDKAKEYRKKNAARFKVLSFLSNLKKYGLSLQDYTSLLNKQQNVCAICKKPPKQDNRLVIDHDHNSKKVRGLLCSPCNLALGHVEAQSDLYALVDYLLRT